MSASVVRRWDWAAAAVEGVCVGQGRGCKGGGGCSGWAGGARWRPGRAVSASIVRLPVASGSDGGGRVCVCVCVCGRDGGQGGVCSGRAVLEGRGQGGLFQSLSCVCRYVGVRRGQRLGAGGGGLWRREGVWEVG